MPNKCKQLMANSKNSMEDSPHIPYILNGELYEIKTRDGENVTVKCCNCPADRVYRGSVRSTGNFHMHIKRRHSDLLGKLHDMKVTALLQRRDRLRNVRRNSQRIKNVVVEEKRELKIKTVFKRHKQEQQRQDEAMKKKSIETLNSDKLQISTAGAQTCGRNNVVAMQNVPDSNVLPQPNEYIPQLKTPEEVSSASLDHQSTSLNNANFINGITTHVNFDTMSAAEATVTTANMTNVTSPVFNSIGHFINTNNAALRGSNFLHAFTIPFGVIKPEQMTAQPMTQAIDLTMNHGSSYSNTNSQSSPNFEITPNISITEPDWNSSINNFRDIFMRIDTTLRDIHHELNARNQIESKRVLMELTKFKFQHPEFSYQF